jgi:hypothetical protein
MSPPKTPSTHQYTGYANDRTAQFKKEKEEIFHLKHGRFAQKPTGSTTSSLSNSRESTMLEPGAQFALDNLFEDSAEKLFALGSICKDID